MATKKTTDLVPRADGSLDVAQVMEQIKAGQKLHIADTDVDGEAMAVEILERKLNAQSADELFSDPGLSKAEEFIGTPFRLDTVHFRNSDFDEGCGIYAIIGGVTEHGEGVTIGCGATNVVVMCLKGLELGAFPRWVKISEDRTKGGFTVYNLVPAKGAKLLGVGEQSF